MMDPLDWARLFEGLIGGFLIVVCLVRVAKRRRKTDTGYIALASAIFLATTALESRLYEEFDWFTSPIYILMLATAFHFLRITRDRKEVDTG